MPPLAYEEEHSEGSRDDNERMQEAGRLSILRSGPWALNRTRSVSRLGPRWLLPDGSVLANNVAEEIHSDSDTEDNVREEMERFHPRFSEANNYTIVPRTEHFDESINGTFGNHARHEEELNIPNRIQQSGLLKCMNTFLSKRRKQTCSAHKNNNKRNSKAKRGTTQQAKVIARGLKRKHEHISGSHVNTGRLAEIMKSLYLKQGVCFKTQAAHDVFSPNFKIDYVSTNDNRVSGKFFIENSDIGLHFEGSVVDLIDTDFRFKDVNSKNNPLIEGSIFSNLLRNAICFDDNLKGYIGRYSNTSYGNAAWKPFIMDKYGYLKCNRPEYRSKDSNSFTPVFNYNNPLTPRLSHSEPSESEISVCDDLDENDTHANVMLNTPAPTIKLSPELHNGVDVVNDIKQIHVQPLTVPKFSSTSLFHFYIENTSSYHLQYKLMANWFFLPPFVEFLHTPTPPTPPKSHIFDSHLFTRTRGHMNPENVLICEKCLLGNSSFDSNEGQTQDDLLGYDSGLMGKYIFIKGTIDIEDVLWEDVFEEENIEESNEQGNITNKVKRVKFELKKKNYKHLWMVETKVKSDLVFKRRRRLAKTGYNFCLNSYSGSNENSLATRTTTAAATFLNSRIEPSSVIRDLTRIVPNSTSQQISTSESDWENEASDTNSNESLEPVTLNVQNNEDNFERTQLQPDSFSEEDDDLINSDVGETEIYNNSTSTSAHNDGNRRRDGATNNLRFPASSLPNHFITDLLYTHGSGDSFVHRNGFVFARNLYKNDYSGSYKYKIGLESYRLHQNTSSNRSRDKRKNLNYRINDRKAPDTMLSAREREEEYRHHLKLNVMMVINRSTGEMNYVPANLDIKNWSVEQNNGELFQDIDTFKKMWEIFNDNIKCEDPLLNDMKQSVQFNPKYKRVEKLLVLHGLTNGSIVDGMKKYKDDLYNDLEPLISELSNSNIIDKSRVVTLEPVNDSIPYSFEYA